MARWCTTGASMRGARHPTMAGSAACPRFQYRGREGTLAWLSRALPARSVPWDCTAKPARPRCLFGFGFGIGEILAGIARPG